MERGSTIIFYRKMQALVTSKTRELRETKCLKRTQKLGVRVSRLES